jgi:alkyl hydroperoxide reductase subunit AhpF
MAGLSTEDRSAIEKKFEILKDPVTILLHKPEGKEEQFDDFMAGLEEICSMSELLTHKDMVEMETNEDIIHDVDMFPALVLLDKDGSDHGIRFYGVPTSKTFTVFIDTIVLFSTGDVGLDKEELEGMEKLEENRLRILCTPNVPDIDRYLNMTIRMSYVNEKIECAIIDLIQFPDIAEKYRVLDMPKTISNEELRFTGVYDLKETMEILNKKIGDAEV